MRLLLDESLPSRLRRSLLGHAVKTVVEMGWGGIRNGTLLALASEQFDAFITADKNLPYQQNIAKLPIAVVVLAARSNELLHLPLVSRLEETPARLQPCTLTRVGD